MFFLSNYVGTPTLTRALPVIKRYADQQVVLVGNFTGAQPQREAPYVEHVFNVRASYRQEMAALVDRFWQMGARKFGVYYQVDAYGRSGTDGVARALAARNARIVAEATYARGAKFEEDMSPAVNALRRAGVRRRALHRGLPGLRGLRAHRARPRLDACRSPTSRSSARTPCSACSSSTARRRAATTPARLVNSQVVPSYDDISAARRGRVPRPHGRAQARTLPEALRDAKYAPQKYSFISLEGYVNARVIVEALRRAGPAPTRRRPSGRRWSRSGASTSASARRSTSAPSVIRGWTASTSPASTASAGCRSPTGPRRSGPDMAWTV